MKQKIDKIIDGLIIESKFKTTSMKAADKINKAYEIAYDILDDLRRTGGDDVTFQDRLDAAIAKVPVRIREEVIMAINKRLAWGGAI